LVLNLDLVPVRVRVSLFTLLIQLDCRDFCWQPPPISAPGELNNFCSRGRSFGRAFLASLVGLSSLHPFFLSSVLPLRKTLFFLLLIRFPLFSLSNMECVRKYLDNLSQFRAADLSQCQTTLVFGLGAVGGAFILCHAFTFLRVLLSLFVLPGKSVCCALCVVVYGK
jgi:hypothetical protein